MSSASLLKLARIVAVVMLVAIDATDPVAVIAQTRSSPLTLGSVLRAVASATGNMPTPGLTDAAAARARLVPSLQSDLSVAPDVGVPAKYTLSQQLSFDLGSRAGRLGRAGAARAAAAQVVASLATSQRAAAQNAIGAFYAVASDQTALATASENVALARRTLQATRERRWIGVAPRVDEDRAQTTLRSSEADLAAATAALDADRASLSELVAMPVASVTIPGAASIPTLDIVRDAALARNPIVASARAERAANAAALLTARGEAAPTFSVGAGAALTGDRFQQTVGPVVSAAFAFPVSTNVSRANVGAARAKVAAADIAVAQARRDAVQSALRLRAQALAAHARLAPLRDAVASARRVVDATLAGYRLGAVGGADLIAAQTQFATARAVLDGATLGAAQATTALQLEIGELPS